MIRTFTIIVAACLMMLNVRVQAAEVEQSDIAGKWASKDRTTGGLGSRFNFTQDGVVSFSFGALVDSDYIIEGQYLKETLKNNNEQTHIIPFEIIGDKLVLNPSDPEKRQEMTRAAAIAANAHPGHANE